MALQEHWIDKLDRGPWARHVRVALAGLLLLALILGYNWRGYHNLDTEEAMDSAQVARNLAEGKGYSTLCVRPYSLYLVKERNEERYAGTIPPTNADFYSIKEAMHPDLANPPLYPTVLAAWMKVYPLGLTAADFVRKYTPVVKGRMPPIDQNWKNRLWQNNGRFGWAPEDYFITVLNQGMFLLVVVMTYHLARRLFDQNVARLTAASLLGCELMWRFSVSGLSTLLLMVLFLGLIWSLLLLDEEFREPRRSLGGMLRLTLVPGFLLGAGTLTIYSFGWLVLPVLAFFAAYSGRRRATMMTITLLIFATMLAPWIFRNCYVGGLPFGTRTFAVTQNMKFMGNRLERAFHPDFKGNYVRGVSLKLRSNVEQLVREELPRLGGSWVMPFFVVGLMLRFRNPGINRLRNFLLWTIVTLVVVQALGRTHLSEDSPEINTENLLVLLTPMVLVYGVSLFFILLDQMELALPKLRYVVIAVFWIVVCLPLFGVLSGWKLPPKTYPPYAPDVVRRISGWMKENELLMSDIPWAVAWYGHRQCAQLTLGADSDFYELNDYIKPVRCLYLTQETTDIRLYTDWMVHGERSWGSFVASVMFREQIAPSFPLRTLKLDLVPGQIVAIDRERWNEEEGVKVAKEPELEE